MNDRDWLRRRVRGKARGCAWVIAGAGGIVAGLMAGLVSLIAGIAATLTG